MNDNIILIGMPSSGKSTLGRQLAERLGFTYLDTDDVIRQQNGCSLQDIIDRDGPDVFRQREEAAICSVQCSRTVIATGGSVVYLPQAMAHLRALGTVVYLSMSFDDLCRRIGDPRVRGVLIPEGFTFRDLYDERVPLYRRYADLTVEEAPGEDAAHTLARLVSALEERAAPAAAGARGIPPPRPPGVPPGLWGFGAGRQFMVQNGNPTQWAGGHPAKALVEDDIARGQLYVVTADGQIHGVFAFILGDDPMYAVIMDGAWLSNAPYGTLHRVASDGQIHGLLAAAVAFARQTTAHLRIDTHADNLPMQRAIGREGFSACGTVFAPDGTPRIAFELLP